MEEFTAFPVYKIAQLLLQFCPGYSAFYFYLVEINRSQLFKDYLINRIIWHRDGNLESLTGLFFLMERRKENFFSEQHTQPREINTLSILLTDYITFFLTVMLQ